MSKVILISDDSDEENKPFVVEKNLAGARDNDQSSLPCTEVGNSKESIKLEQDAVEKTKKTSEELFVEFFDFCVKGLKNNQHGENILKYLQGKHKKASKEYTTSRQYRKLLQSYVHRLHKGSTEVVVFINDVTTILDGHKETIKRRTSLEHRTTETKAEKHSLDEEENHCGDSKRIKTDETQEENKVESPLSSTPCFDEPQKPTCTSIPQSDAPKANDQAPDRNSASTSAVASPIRPSESSVRSPVSQRNHLKKIKYLEHLLKQLSEEITRLQQQEISLDEMDESDSVYIQESLLKKRCIKVYKKLCLLNKSAVVAGRVKEQVIKVRSSRFEEINKKVERYINHPAAPFPDFNDIYILVKKANEKKNLNLIESTINSTAQNIFTEVGEKLQKRRQEDFVYEFGSSLIDKVKDKKDPADNDEELRRKLINNRKLSRMNLDSVIEKYTRMQYEMTEQELAKVNEESDHEQEEEEEEEERPGDPTRDEPDDEIGDDYKAETEMMDSEIQNELNA